MKTTTFISLEQAEKNYALTIIFICMIAMTSIGMAFFVGFKAGDKYHQSIADSEHNALHIASDKQASRFGE